MKTYIVDSNIVFSAALNPTSQIGKFLISSERNQVKFHSADYLKTEIGRYIPKLIRLSGLEEGSIKRILELIYSRITFTPDDKIPFKYYKNAVPFFRDIDMNDLVFLALTDYLKGELWTGDMELYRGLTSKGYNKVLTFQEIKKELDL
ncbi:MAG: PIN domain-containing protein [Bacteroidota bacterium]